MEFSPANNVVKLCLQGMDLEANGKNDDAQQLFQQAWNEATNDFEKFTAGYHLARIQSNAGDKLKWYDTTLHYALKIDNAVAKAAYSMLYSNIANCYEAMGDTTNAQKNKELAASATDEPADKGPFYHGTRADLKTGDVLVAGRTSNYNTEVTMNHIYFTAGANGAGLAAALAKGDGLERVYIVEPTGSFENDPNVTNKKFPATLPALTVPKLHLK